MQKKLHLSEQHFNLVCECIDAANTRKTEGQEPLSVSRPVYSLVIQDKRYMIRNIIIWKIAVFIQNTSPYVCMSKSLAGFGPEQVLGPEVPLT